MVNDLNYDKQTSLTDRKLLYTTEVVHLTDIKFGNKHRFTTTWIGQGWPLDSVLLKIALVVTLVSIGDLRKITKQPIKITAQCTPLAFCTA